MGTKKTFITAALASAAFAAVPTVASASPSDGLTKSYDAAYHQVVRAGGQPGRDIADDGVQKGGKDRPATSAELRDSLATLRSMTASLTGAASTGASASTGQAGTAATGSGPAATGQATTGATGQTSTGQATGGQSSGSGDLSGVAACESGGNPSAVSPDGQYRGKYQFDQKTWESVGGTGDPAAAPEAVQDQKAQELEAQRGSNPWPVCGR